MIVEKYQNLVKTTIRTFIPLRPDEYAISAEIVDTLMERDLEKRKFSFDDYGIVKFNNQFKVQMIATNPTELRIEFIFKYKKSMLENPDNIPIFMKVTKDTYYKDVFEYIACDIKEYPSNITAYKLIKIEEDKVEKCTLEDIIQLYDNTIEEVLISYDMKKDKGE